MDYYNEFDPEAAAWLEELIRQGELPPGVVDTRSIVDVHPDDLRPFEWCHFFAGIGVWPYALARLGWPRDRRTWTGSPPCQPFSAAGKGLGVADERHLWPAYFHLIDICRPDDVLGEQVASKDGLAWLDIVRPDMEGAAYAFGVFDLCSAGVGSPNRRQRLYFYGTRGMADARGVGQRAGLCDSRPTGFRRHESSDCSEFGRLADSDGGRRQARPWGRPLRTEPDAGDGGRTSRMADVAGSGWGEEHSIGGRIRSRDASKRDAAGLDSSRPFSRVANANHPERRANLSRGDDGEREDAGWSQGSGDLGVGRPDGGVADDDRTGPTNGFWEHADWLRCRDGKWRSVEPGTFPLVTGSPARVGLLRGYGNACNAELATEFAASILDAAAAGFAPLGDLIELQAIEVDDDLADLLS